MIQEDKIAPLIQQIVEAIVNQKANVLEACVQEMDILFLEVEHFPDQLFDSVLELIQNPAFQRFQKSWVLLTFFNDAVNVEKFSPPQREHLLHVLVEIYPSLREPTACLLVVEFIVNLCHKEQSIEILCTLKNVQAEVPRALIAYGFRYFIQHCSDTSLRQRALQALVQMKHDSSEDVRQEVRDALARLQMT